MDTKTPRHKHIYEPISEHATPHTCGDCMAYSTYDPHFGPSYATQWRFNRDMLGAINRTARTAVCDRHAGKRAA